jgi:hypothetical protein
MSQDESKEASEGGESNEAQTLQESIEQRWQRLVDESREENDQTEKAEAVLNSDNFKVVLKPLKMGTECAVTIIGAVAKVSETVVPFIQIVDFALGHVEEFAENFASNQSEAENLPKGIRRCGIIVLKDMISKVREEDKESFISVAQEFMELLVKVWKTCNKWKGKKVEEDMVNRKVQGTIR